MSGVDIFLNFVLFIFFLNLFEQNHFQSSLILRIFEEIGLSSHNEKLNISTINSILSTNYPSQFHCAKIPYFTYFFLLAKIFKLHH